jgi:hypothetical protein
MPFQFADSCFTHFPVDLMINGFDLSNWNSNDKSDLSPFILPDEFIAMIENKYNFMIERLRH